MSREFLAFPFFRWWRLSIKLTVNRQFWGFLPSILAPNDGREFFTTKKSLYIVGAVSRLMVSLTANSRPTLCHINGCIKKIRFFTLQGFEPLIKYVESGGSATNSTLLANCIMLATMKFLHLRATPSILLLRHHIQDCWTASSSPLLFDDPSSKSIINYDVNRNRRTPTYVTSEQNSRPTHGQRVGNIKNSRNGQVSLNARNRLFSTLIFFGQPQALKTHGSRSGWR